MMKNGKGIDYIKLNFMLWKYDSIKIIKREGIDKIESIFLFLVVNENRAGWDKREEIKINIIVT